MRSPFIIPKSRKYCFTMSFDFCDMRPSWARAPNQPKKTINTSKNFINSPKRQCPFGTIYKILGTIYKILGTICKILGILQTFCGVVVLGVACPLQTAFFWFLPTSEKIRFQEITSDSKISRQGHMFFSENGRYFPSTCVKNGAH